MFGIDDAALALALSAGISTAGGLYTNSQNRKAQKSINEQALNVAALNNATQIEMANSAHQREISDLRKAGLNPILSAGGSGASVPQLQSPNLGTPSVTNPVSDAAHSASQLTRYMGSSLENLQADTAVKNGTAGNLVADTDLKRNQADNVLADIEVKQNTAENLATQNKNLDAQNALYKAQTLETLARAEREAQETEYPGMFGQAFRTAKNAAGSWLRTGFGAWEDITSAAKTVADPVTWSSPSRQARRYGTGGGSSVEVDYKPASVPPPRAMHEGSKFNVPSPKSKRRHN